MKLFLAEVRACSGEAMVLKFLIKNKSLQNQETAGAAHSLPELPGSILTVPLEMMNPRKETVELTFLPSRTVC